jgi:hypothetical protein
VPAEHVFGVRVTRAWQTGNRSRTRRPTTISHEEESAWAM